MTRKQSGLTLIEVIVVMAISGLIMAPLAAVLYQFIWIPQQTSGELTLTNNLRLSARWLTSDARQAQDFAPGSASDDYGTFIWTDRSSFPVTNYIVSYYYDSSQTSLMRKQTVDGSAQSIVVASNVKDYGDVTIQELGGVVTASVTLTFDSLRGSIFRTIPVIKAKMRTILPAALPDPPPLRLAWDDFEDGGWRGGSGWLGKWNNTENAAIVTTGTPYEGSYHLMLRSSTDYVNRSLNLSGQTIYLQFWAKANSFGPGDTATVSVSSNGTIWTPVKTWGDGEADNIYRPWDIDLSAYSMTSEFWIAFRANMSSSADFYVDDLKVVRAW